MEQDNTLSAREIESLGGFSMKKYDLLATKKRLIYRNPSIPLLYELAIKYEEGTQITNTGALATFSGEKTGRCPSDKRIVQEEETKDDIWWGDINIRLDEETFLINKSRALDFLHLKERLYVTDGYACWNDRYKIKVRVISTRAYHSLFMYNMLIRPTDQELQEFGEPDWVIINSGEFPANKYTRGMTSNVSVDINFSTREFVILGTEYAGEMKKGIFTVINYLMPKVGVLSLHSSANESKEGGEVTLFFGLSGTGKTTLSADPNRLLIGDDEHCWGDDGVFNIEGGCYAKCIGLRKEKEPEIYNAIRFGSVLENVVIDEKTRIVDYDSDSITENTRSSFPLEFIPNAKIPALGNHPKNVIMLTLDAFGVLPPVSRLTPEQAMYHFICGYTAKVAGTEVGIIKPQATFSPCFGAPFMVWHPTVYASLLAKKIRKHNTTAWLVNTGWTGGPYGVGQRISLRYTRAIIDSINNGTLVQEETQATNIFGLLVPTKCPGVPSEILWPRNTWKDPKEYDESLHKLAKEFTRYFERFRKEASDEIRAGGPVV